MATKKFNQMSTKKLNALMATASEEDKVAIQEILDARAQVQAAQNPDEHAVPEENSALTPEEEAAIAAAEANNGINSMYAGKAEKKPKITEEELDNLYKSVEVNKEHKCQVLSMSTLEWQNGYVVDVVKDEKRGRVVYAIRLDDGKKISKNVATNLVRVLDETVDLETIEKETKKAKKTSASHEKTVDFKTDEELAEAFATASLNRGKMVTFKAFGKSEDTLTGRIMGLIVDRRVNRIMYTINAITGQDKDGKDIVKKYNKMINSSDLTIAEEFDEIGQEIQDRYQNRNSGEAKPKSSMTAKERVMFYGERLEKAEKAFEELKAKIEKYKEFYSKAQVDLEAEAQAQAEANTQAEQTEELA